MGHSITPINSIIEIRGNRIVYTIIMAFLKLIGFDRRQGG